MCVLTCIQSALAAAPGGEWWNASYLYRQRIEFPAGTTALPTGYSVSFTVNHASLVAIGQSQISGNDMRIVRWTGSGWTELNRVADPDTGWNLNNSRIWFQTQTQVNANTTEDNYYLYYGNAAAGAPPQNSSQVFLFYDDFSGASLDLTKWTVVGNSPIVSVGQMTMNVSDRIRSLGTFGTNTIWESLIQMPNNLPGGSQATFHYWQANNSAANNANQYLTSGTHVGFKAIAGSTIDSASPNQILSRNAVNSVVDIVPGNPTVLQRYAFARVGTTSATFFIGGTQVGTLTTEIPTGSLPIQLFNAANGSRTQVYDWARVRAYRNPEPVLTLVSEGSIHFVVAHDGYGIHCVAEPVTVHVRDAANNPYIAYGQPITLNTNGGRGNWSLVTGGGSLDNGNANDGIATYQWSGADTSTTFALSYPEGTPAINISVTQNSDALIRDDDTEALLTWTPSGFTITSAPLSNPPPVIIPAFSSPQTAGSDFPIYITAYGTTPTDSTCGVIEGYTGGKNLRFWSSYVNPGTGTRNVTINGGNIATGEGAAAAQAIAFTNGQANVMANYADVGLINIQLKDDTTGNPSLPTGIRGATGNMVVRPASFVLSNIRRTSDNVANPAAADATGAVFIGAGQSFTATVTAINSNGVATPNFGRESTPESVALVSTLILPAGGNNPGVDGPTGFATFNNGVSTGTDFSWAEVGIVTLTPQIRDGDYLGAGNVVGSVTGNIGRFIPNDFLAQSLSTPSFGPSCLSSGYVYMGQPMTYATGAAPMMSLTARAVGGSTTQNYQGQFFKLQSGAPTTHTYTSPTAGTLDNSALSTTGNPVISSIGPGIATVVFNNASGLRFARPAAPVAPYATPLTMSLSADIRDADTVTTSVNPFLIAGITSPEQRWGRVAFRNAVGSELLNLPLGLRAEYFLNDNAGFAQNTADICTTNVSIDPASLVFGGSLNSGETCILDAGSPGTSGVGCSAAGPAASQYRSPPTAVEGGSFNAVLRAPGAGNGGTVTLTAVVPDWLLFDWNAATPALERPSGIATFGIFQGNSRRIYQGEK
jgi:hypothetical protein